MQVTAAHEYNHVLQYAYDTFQDTWMFEATATWAEEKVFDPRQRLRLLPQVVGCPPGRPGCRRRWPLAEQRDLKMYGSAIWNHWLDGPLRRRSIRQAWALGGAHRHGSRGFAPACLRQPRSTDAGGPGFAAELRDFAAATASGTRANSGIREGSTFPTEVARRRHS